MYLTFFSIEKYIFLKKRKKKEIKGMSDKIYTLVSRIAF